MPEPGDSDFPLRKDCPGLGGRGGLHAVVLAALAGGLYLGLLSGTRLWAEAEPPLPVWDAGDTLPPSLTPGNAFGELLPEGTRPAAGGPGGLDYLNQPPVLLNDRTGAGLDVQDLPLFLHSRLLESGRQSVANTPPAPTPILALKEVPDQVRANIAKTPLQEYLIDPQTLLTEMPAQDLERLLAFHAAESRIAIRLVVLRRDQKLSAAADTLAALERPGPRKLETCIAVYPLGEPWRARFFLSQNVSRHSSVTGLTEMSEDCVADAMQVTDAEEQIKRFAVRLSTRLFWLEKALPAPVAAEPSAAVAGADAAAVAVPVSGLREVRAAEERLPAETLPGGAASLEEVRLLRSALIGLGSLFVAVAVAWLAQTVVGWLRRRRQKGVWLLPEPEPSPRLGGAFSGGMGAAVSFADTPAPGSTPAPVRG